VLIRDSRYMNKWNSMLGLILCFGLFGGRIFAQNIEEYKEYRYADNWADFVNFASSENLVIVGIDIRIEQQHSWGFGTDYTKFSYTLQNKNFVGHKYRLVKKNTQDSTILSDKTLFVNRFRKDGLMSILENVKRNRQNAVWTSSYNGQTIDLTEYNQTHSLFSSFRTQGQDDTYVRIFVDFYTDDFNRFTYYIGFYECMCSGKPIIDVYNFDGSIDKYGVIQWLMLCDLFRLSLPNKSRIRLYCFENKEVERIYAWYLSRQTQTD